MNIKCISTSVAIGLAALTSMQLACADSVQNIQLGFAHASYN